MYISKKVSYKLKRDLNIYNPQEFESTQHPPHTLIKPHKFDKMFLELLSTIKDQNIISTGNVNLNNLNQNKKPETYLFLEVIFTNNFLPLIILPTRVIKSSATLIDNILINKEDIQRTRVLAKVKNYLVNTIFPI